jgi:hypothetical protein
MKAIKHNTNILVTKWKPFEELFKSKTTPGQPNPGNQCTRRMRNYKVFILTKPL